MPACKAGAVGTGLVARLELADPTGSPHVRHRSLVVRVAVPWGLLFAAYLVPSVALWWRVWSAHPAGTMTCLCGDPAQTLWFVAWVAHAIAHLRDPLLSTAVAHPTGVNLLANQSSVLIGVLLAPVTWLFGPVASLNVALTAAAPANAVAAAALCRRFAGWGPAVAGGALFGFSPLVVSELEYAHLADTVLVFLPVMALCLHELLVRQRGRPAAWGAGLAAAATAQFFTSAEMLVVFAVVAAPVSAGALAVRWWRWSARHPGGGSGCVATTGPDTAGEGAPLWRPRHAAVGLGVAGIGVIVLLAGPTWFALAGPQHISGPVWADAGAFGVPWTSFFSAPAPDAATRQFAAYTGYLGSPGLPVAYLGPWLLAVLAVGVAAARRRSATWGALGTLLLASVLALGANLLPFAWYSSWWMPWRAVAGLPVLDDVIPQRMVAVGLLGAAVLLAVTLQSVLGPVPARGSSIATNRTWARLADHWGSRWRQRALRPAVATCLAVVALVGLAGGTGGPLVVTSASPPRWFAQVAPRLGGGAVLLVLPFPSGRVADAMGWQAMDGFSFSMAGAYAKVPGPNGKVQYAGAPGSATAILSQLTEVTGPLPTPTPTASARIREALVRWHVTEVVATLRQVGALYPARYAATFLTAVFGRLPTVQAAAWVWRSPLSATRPAPAGEAAMQRCAALADRPGAPMMAGPSCILRAGDATSPTGR